MSVHTHLYVQRKESLAYILYLCAQTHTYVVVYMRGTRNATNRAHAIWFVLILTYGFYGLK